MTALTFETGEALLTLEQNGDDEGVPVISLRLGLSAGPTVYVSGGRLLQAARWRMRIRADDGAHELGSLSYTDDEGKGECMVVINQSAGRFHALLEMFKGGQASEISIEADGMQRHDDYSSHWDIGARPRLAVMGVSFEFPLPQNEA